MKKPTKKELLDRYQEREPQLFIQIDGLKIKEEGVDNLMPPDEEGFWFQARRSFELMDGVDLSVWIDPKADLRDIVSMLKKIMAKMDHDWSDLFKEANAGLETAGGIEGIAESLIRIRGFQVDDFERLVHVAKEKLGAKEKPSDGKCPFW